MTQNTDKTQKWIDYFTKEIKEPTIGKKNLYMILLRTTLIMLPVIAAYRKRHNVEIIIMRLIQRDLSLVIRCHLHMGQDDPDDGVVALLIRACQKLTDIEDLATINAFFKEEYSASRAPLGKLLETTLHQRLAEENVNILEEFPLAITDASTDPNLIGTRILGFEDEEKIIILHNNFSRDSISVIIRDHFCKKGYNQAVYEEGKYTTSFTFINEQGVAKAVEYAWNLAQMLITVKNIEYIEY